MSPLKSIALFVTLALSACATGSTSKDLPELNGIPMAAIMQALGRPLQEQAAAGQTVYTWISEETGTYDVPATGLTPVISSVHGQPIVTYSRSDFPYRQETYNWTCHLDITAEKGVVIRAHEQSTGGGCRFFNKKLDPLAKKKRAG